MFRKVMGFISGVLSLGSSMFVVMALSDLIGGGSTTSNGVLLGLLVFFGGLTAMTGWGALRLLRDPTTTATTNATTTTTTTTTTNAPGGIDIALEAKILELAALRAGRLTVAEVAVACHVSLDVAGAGLDQLAGRGHADLAVADDGSSVYLVKGLLSQVEKEEAQVLG